MKNDQRYYQIIELILIWEGRINATDLTKITNVSRQTASNKIKAFEKENKHILKCISSDLI